MDQIKSHLRTTQVRLLLVLFTAVVVGLSVMAVVVGRMWVELLFLVLGVVVGEGIAYAITAPPQTRKRNAIVLLCALPAYFVVSILDLIFGFMPGWSSTFFEMYATLPGNFAYGLIFGIAIVAGMRLMRYFQEWIHGG